MNDYGDPSTPFDIDDVDPLVYSDTQDPVELRRDWRADVPQPPPQRTAPERRGRRGVPAWTPDVPVPERSGVASGAWPLVAATGFAGVVVFAFWLFMLVRSWLT